jgi:hypothetical protein
MLKFLYAPFFRVPSFVILVVYGIFLVHEAPGFLFTKELCSVVKKILLSDSDG